ncbi:MAG: beta-galactosidase [Candidatus Daviesbacteria bacterium]|nr:beta-galactosidase [Candidatus Daviesbacteria bacterium]
MKHHLSKLYYQKEHLKIIILILIIILVVVIIRANNLLETLNSHINTAFGISYSPQYAQALGLDPKQTYQAILKDLNVKNIRLSAYWNEINPAPDKYDFTDLDYYINEAEKNNANVILAIGYKLFRWPECRAPGWLPLDNTQYREEKQLEMIKEVVKYYEKNPTIKVWQIENEPFLKFGICPRIDSDFLKTEVAIVKAMSAKPILMTDSGELSTWITPMQLGNYFGTTLYRTVKDNWVGRIDYPIKPWFYRAKAIIVKNIFSSNNQKIMISELQTEPWTNKFVAETPIDQQIKDFPLSKMEDNVNFAKKVGFSDIYLWGVEWWYWIKIQGYPEYWEYARELFKN